MPAVSRIDPKTVFTPDEWRHLTSRSSLRGMWLVCHAWGLIAASIALVTLRPPDLADIGHDRRHAPAWPCHPDA